MGNKKVSAFLNSNIGLIVFADFIFILLVLLFGIHDETSDDYGMQMLISSVNGQPTWIQPWCQPIWCIITYLIQRLVPVFAWHYALQIILILVAFNLFEIWIVDNINIKSKWIIVLLPIVIIYFESVFMFNFTRTAAVLIGVGTLNTVKSKKTVYRITGVILILFGSLIRDSVFYIIVGFLAVYFAYTLLLHIRSEKQIIKMTMLKIAKVSGVLLSLFLVVFISSNLFYRYNSDYRLYKDENYAFSAVVDYPISNYENNEDKYAALGLSENDYQMLVTRMCASDSDFFNSEKYNSIIGKVSLKDSFVPSSFIQDLKDSVIISLFKRISGFLIIALVLYLVFYIPKKGFVFSFLTSLCFIAYLVILSYIGRCPPRVIFAVSFCAITSILLFFSDHKGNKSLSKKGLLVYIPLLVMVLCVSIFRYGLFLNTIPSGTDSQVIELLDFTQAHPDRVYVYTSDSFRGNKSVDNVLLMNSYSDISNLVSATGFTFPKSVDYKLNKKEIKNIYSDCINNNNVMFIDKSDTINVIAEYIKEHYNHNAYIHLENQIGAYNIYSVKSSSD